MFKNKLNIIALGLALGIVATPALTFAVNLPDSPEDGFNCPLEYPKERDLTPAEIKANFVCLDRKTTALFTWIDAIVKILEQSEITPLPGNVIKPPSTGGGTLPVEEQIKFDKGKVTVVQDFLKGKGLFKYPQSTGYYGEITKKAVTDFQKQYGLTANGNVDEPTLEKIRTLDSGAAARLK